MKKSIIIFSLTTALSLALTGCSGSVHSESQSETTVQTVMSENTTEDASDYDTSVGSSDSDIHKDAVYVHSSESELDKIGLDFTLKNISPAGATLIFCQYDAEAPTGRLQTSDGFVLEVQKNGTWEEVPIILEDYGFHYIAYMITPEAPLEINLNWEWLYGTLDTGTYRIKKEILDFRDTGDFDEYTIYAQFIIN